MHHRITTWYTIISESFFDGKYRKVVLQTFLAVEKGSLLLPPRRP